MYICDYHGKRIYVYDIGYSSYEESSYVQLTHTKKFTEAQLRRAVIKAIITVLKWIDEKKPKEIYLGCHGPGFDDLDKFVIAELEKVGFKRIKFQAEFSIFGWPSLTDNSHWEGQRGGALDKVYDAIPVKLRESITALGNQREEEMVKAMEERQKAREIAAKKKGEGNV
jgi:hypothetical protein